MNCSGTRWIPRPLNPSILPGVPWLPSNFQFWESSPDVNYPRAEANPVNGAEHSDTIARFSGRRYINLESYKKSGESKLTPVQSIEDAGLIYVRTDPRTWKVKRIRRNPSVRIVPSDRNGKPTEGCAAGEARILEGEESNRAMKLFREEMVPSVTQWST